RRRLAARDPSVRLAPVVGVLLDTRTVTLCDFVDGEAERVVFARADRDHEARTISCPDDDVLRVRRAMHEVPRPQLPLPAFDDQNCLARDDEEVLLVALPVVQSHRLARPEHERIEAELLELPFA